MRTDTLLCQLINKQDLTETQARLLLTGMICSSHSDLQFRPPGRSPFGHLGGVFPLANSSKLGIKDKVSPLQIGAILTALTMKGETTDEIAGFITAMRQNMVCLNLKNAIDVCGTGGDNSGTFNISTAVSFVVAGSGIRVAKHGNRAASGKCGSADVLEEMGVNIYLSPHQAKRVFEKTGIVFLFAPLFHPAMKNVARIRKKLKFPTVFNLLGPFANPAAVSRQLIGVPKIETAKKLAEVSKKLGYKHLIIVSSFDGLDEASTSSKTAVFEIKGKLVKKSVINPSDYNFKKTFKKELYGGSPKKNAVLINQILKGEKGAKRDVVVLNSAFALYAAGAVSSISQGIKMAKISIDSSKARLVLNKLRKETQKYA